MQYQEKTNTPVETASLYQQPALLNFGTRAVNLGHSLRHLHDKNKLDLFQC